MRTEFSGLFLFQRQQLSAAFRLLSVRQLSGQFVCNRTFSAGIFENMHFKEMNLFQKCLRHRKFLRSFSRETDDYIRRNRRMFKILAENLHFFIVFLRRIMSIHPLERFIAATLQGQVKMRTKLRNRRQPSGKLFCDDTGLQRTQTDSANAVHLCDFLQQRNQIGAFKCRSPQIFSVFQVISVRLSDKIHAVGAQMNTGDDYLLKAFFRQPSYLSQHILLLSAPDASTHKWNDTIRAELVAAVLNLDIRARVLRALLHAHFLILPHGADVCHSAGVCSMLLQIRLQNLHDILFMLVSHRQINAVVHSVFLVRLYKAPDRNDNRVRIFVLCPVQHLTALPVCNVGYGTGIYNINVRIGIKRHNFISPIL